MCLGEFVYTEDLFRDSKGIFEVNTITTPVLVGKRNQMHPNAIG